MAKLMRNMLLLAKTETTQGTDSVPTAALNSILARGIAPTPVNAEFAERNLIRPYFGSTGSVQVQSFSQIEFEVELAGSGAAGTAPRWAPLLQACGFSQTLTASVKADYAPLTTNQTSVTIYVFLDGVRHVMVGCKGNVSFALSARGIPVMRYTFIGYTSTVTDVTNPTGSDFSGFQAPLAVNKTNTPTFTLHGTAVKATELNIDMGNEVNYRNYIGSEDVAFTNRNPSGSATFEYDAMSVRNWFNITNLGTLGALQMIHGLTAGNIVQIDAPRVQITNPSISDDGGIAMLSVGLGLQPNLGNDEILISVR
jgi:hypothetical protein